MRGEEEEEEEGKGDNIACSLIRIVLLVISVLRELDYV